MQSYTYPKLYPKYPSVNDLKVKAKKRIPNVAWEYLETGTGDELTIDKNRSALDKINLYPRFGRGKLIPKLSTTLLGQTYTAPYGIAPVGLTGLMWPQAEVYLANAAHRYGIPFTLSTVATETPERIGPLAGDLGWFQLYAPHDPQTRQHLLSRAWSAGFKTLVVTVDVPMPSRRERVVRAGLTTPPKVTPSFVWQGLKHPTWTINTLRRGLPRLRTVEQYSESKSLEQISYFMRDRWRGDISVDYLKAVRDEWKGNLIIKGILHQEDVDLAINIGADAIVVSNHGGRQFDGAPASITALQGITAQYKGRIPIIFDSGVRSGLDIVKALACGADFVLLGRAFLYAVAALGEQGVRHCIDLLSNDIQNNMVQLGVEGLNDLKDFKMESL